MKRLGPEQINGWRTIATWVMRSVSVILVTTGGYLVFKRVLFGLATGDLTTAYQMYDEVGENQSFSRGLAMVAFGAVLGLLGQRLARWIVVPAMTCCPGCGYEKVEGDRCPECGMTGFASPTSNGANEALPR